MHKFKISFSGGQSAIGLKKNIERFLSAAGRCVSAQSGEERQSPGSSSSDRVVPEVACHDKVSYGTDSVNQTVLIIGRKLVYSQVAVGT